MTMNNYKNTKIIKQKILLKKKIDFLFKSPQPKLGGL